MLSPDIVKNSNTLSSEALSLIPACMIGLIFLMSPRVGDDRTLSRASIHARLPRIVLISPLWASRRNGWARLHVGNVLVLKRECTNAKPLVKYGWVRSGKYSRTCIEVSIPLYMMVRHDSDTM